MKKEKFINKKNILIIVICILLVILLGIVIFNFIISNNNSNSVTTNDRDLLDNDFKSDFEFAFPDGYTTVLSTEKRNYTVINGNYRIVIVNPIIINSSDKSNWSENIKNVLSSKYNILAIDQINQNNLDMFVGKIGLSSKTINFMFCEYNDIVYLMLSDANDEIINDFYNNSWYIVNNTKINKDSKKKISSNIEIPDLEKVFNC